MKFVYLALLGLVSVQAVRLHQTAALATQDSALAQDEALVQDSALVQEDESALIEEEETEDVGEALVQRCSCGSCSSCRGGCRRGCGCSRCKSTPWTSEEKSRWASMNQTQREARITELKLAAGTDKCKLMNMYRNLNSLLSSDQQKSISTEFSATVKSERTNYYAAVK